MNARTRKPFALAAGVITAAVVTGAGYAVVGNPFGADSEYGSWSPGVAAPVSAMHSLPPVQSPPSDLLFAVRHEASDTGGSADLATSSLRVLRAGLGVGSTTLYAYTPKEGALCLILWKQAGTCPTISENELSGVQWLYAGAVPAPDGESVLVPSAFVAVIDDSVASVELVSNNPALPSRQLKIINNAVFTDVIEPPRGVAWDLDLVIEYHGGSRKSVVIPDPRTS